MGTEIILGVEAIGTSLWFPMEKILIIGDLHIGYEGYLEKMGLAIPKTQFKETVKMMEKILEEVKPEKIIINGDLKHEFGEISNQEWSETSRFLDLLNKNCKKIVLVKGNHDNILAPIAKKKKLEVVKRFCFEKKIEKKKRIMGRLISLRNKLIKSVCVLHGDYGVKEKEVERADLIVIGHDHPAVTLREGPKREKYKCFLYGKYKKQKLIVMPSFLPGVVGFDVKNFDQSHSEHSHYLTQKLDNFEVFIVGDRVYKFGKLKNI